MLTPLIHRYCLVSSPAREFHHSRHIPNEIRLESDSHIEFPESFSIGMPFHAKTTHFDDTSDVFDVSYLALAISKRRSLYGENKVFIVQGLGQHAVDDPEDGIDLDVGWSKYSTGLQPTLFSKKHCRAAIDAVLTRLGFSSIVLAFQLPSVHCCATGTFGSAHIPSMNISQDHMVQQWFCNFRWQYT